MLVTAEKPSQLLRRFDFFEGNLLRLIHQPEEQMLEIVAIPTIDRDGGKLAEASFVRLLFAGVREFERTGLIAKKFYPTDRPLKLIGASDEPHTSIDVLEVRGPVGDRRLELVAGSLGKLHCHFSHMLWDVRRGAWTEDAQGKVILVDAVTGGQFDFYEPFPNG